MATDIEKSKLANIDFDNPSVQILLEVARLLSAKGKDYNATVAQAEYYPRGLWTLLDVINSKQLRARSVLGGMEADGAYKNSFESLDDTFRDLCAYAAFAASWTNGTLPGQDIHRCGLTSNRPVLNPVGARTSVINDAEALLSHPSVKPVEDRILKAKLDTSTGEELEHYVDLKEEGTD